MKFCAAVLSVADIHTSRKFYEELFGLTLFQDYGINVAYTCGLALQQEFGWLVGLPEEQVRQKPNNVELCFEEEDFDSFLKKLAEYPGIQFLHGVKEHSWGQRVVRFYDPNGHIIEVGESMPVVVRRFLALGMSMEQVSKRMDVSVEDLNKLLNL